MQNWGDLPLELLSSVMAYLEIKDNIRASLVCKSWHEAAVAVRIVEQPPWLLHFSKISNSYEFYNPLNGNKQNLEWPESLTGSIVRYSTDGWLLMSKLNFSDFVLFNPFTRETVVLPPLILFFDYQLVAFSCPPTSNNCVVFTIKDYDPGHVTIRTWSPGQTLWTSIQVESQFLNAEHNKVIFSNGLFYCLNLRNNVAVFDPSLGELDVLDVPPPRPFDHIDCESWYKGKFMVENKGHIYVICTYGNNEHMVFELNLEQGIWEEKRSVGSLTMFVSVISSCESRSYVSDGMKRNSIYFPKLCSNETCSMTYSFHERRYSPCEDSFDWKKECPYMNIWIDPPEDVSELII